MNETDKTRRKILFVKKAFQATFIVRFAMIVLVSSLLFGLILFFTSMGSTTIVFRNLRIESIPTHEYLFPSLTLGFFISLILASILALTITLIYSHRLGGPMYRFEKIFKGLSEGNLIQSAKIRQNDECQDMAKTLDEALGSIRSKMQSIDHAVKELEPHIVNKQDPVLTERISGLKKLLDQFKF